MPRRRSILRSLAASIQAIRAPRRSRRIWVACNVCHEPIPLAKWWGHGCPAGIVTRAQSESLGYEWAEWPEGASLAPRRR